MKKDRYTLYLGDLEIGRSYSIRGIGELIGCTKAHIYHTWINKQFTFKKKVYTITDKLD